MGEDKDTRVPSIVWVTEEEWRIHTGYDSDHPMETGPRHRVYVTVVPKSRLLQAERERDEALDLLLGVLDQLEEASDGETKSLNAEAFLRKYGRL